MTELTQQSQGEKGNTKPSRVRSRGWTWTLNNYTEDEVTQLLSDIDKVKCQYIFGYEVGEEGTPHLQGYFYFKSQVSQVTVKKMLPRAHLETSKGKPKQNFEYCSKDGNFKTNMDFRKPADRIKDLCFAEYKDVVWLPWQQEIIDMLDKPAIKRTMYWYYEPTGNVGKSYLCKWLALTKKIIICEGKKGDIFNQVKTAIDDNNCPEIILMDIPRSALNYVSYGALEALKNGLLYSGKYEGGVCLFPWPHVICFANTEPNYTEMSLDRWEIKLIQSEHTYINA